MTSASRKPIALALSPASAVGRAPAVGPAPPAGPLRGPPPPSVPPASPVLSAPPAPSSAMYASSPAPGRRARRDGPYGRMFQPAITGSPCSVDRTPTVPVRSRNSLPSAGSRPR